MTSATVNLNAKEVRVLAALASVGGEDFNYSGFASIARDTRLDRKAVRRACRSLARKGLAQFGRGLWTEDGTPAGSGYAATAEGVARADEKLTERFVLRRWI